MNDATTPCSRCGAETLESRAHFSDNGMICPGCAQKQTMSELDEQGMFVDRVGNPGGIRFSDLWPDSLVGVSGCSWSTSLPKVRIQKRAP